MQSVYPVELMAIVAYLADHDSLECCQIANRRKQHPQLTNNYIALTKHLQHYPKHFKSTITWIPAQPEKMKSISADRSRDNCLIHVTEKLQ